MSILTTHDPINSDTLDRIIALAAQAWESWSTTSFDDRVAVLRSYQSVLKQRASALAGLISKEAGKPLWEAKTEVTAMINKIDITIQSVTDRCLPLKKDVQGMIHETTYKSHGVIAVLGPFNFPGHLPNGHIVPALLMGNVVVFKPSEFTNNVGQFMVDCWKEAGLPSHVLSLVSGNGQLGKQLVEHPNIHGVFFTGSSTTGQSIQSAMLPFPYKIAALEMGGFNALIVESYDDLQATVELALASAFLTAGQRCTCARRIIVVESPKTQGFIDAFVKQASELPISQDIESDTHTKETCFYGHLIHDHAAKQVKHAAEQLVDAGATELLNEQPLREPFVRPIILDTTSIFQQVPAEEVFGPMVQIVRVGSIDEAIQVVNVSEYGLSLSVLSNREETYQTVYNACRAGLIHWNMPTNGASSAMPFGGVGKSGNFRPSAYFAVDYCCYPVATIKKPSV